MKVRGTSAHVRQWPVRSGWVLLALLLLALFSSLLSLAVGAASLPFREVWGALWGDVEGSSTFILQEYRLPRVALAWLVGVGLGVSGAVIQSVIRNPLAAPDTIGVTGGAGLAAAILLLTYPGTDPAVLPLVAFAGGVAAAALVYLLAYRRGATPVRLALVGVSVGAIARSGIELLLTRHPVEVNIALTWLTGSLWGRGWSEVWRILPWFALLVPLSLLFSHRLDILALGDEMAIGLGERAARTRLLALLLAVALAAACVAVSGTIGFVGLVTPHLARALLGTGQNRIVLPASGLLGAVLLLFADGIGRGLLPPIEIPAGLVTALVGAPFFVYVLVGHSRRHAG